MTVHFILGLTLRSPFTDYHMSHKGSRRLLAQSLLHHQLVISSTTPSLDAQQSPFIDIVRLA